MQTLRLFLFVVAAAPAAAQIANPFQDASPTELMDPVGVQAFGLRCATPSFDRSAFAESTSDCSYSSTSILSEYDATFVYEIPVVFHVIQDSSGTGFLSTSQIDSQIDVLNEDFGAIPGSNGAGGFNTMIEFKLADTDPQGNPTTGITYSTNNTWFNDGGSYWNSLAWDTNRYLNIYSNDASGFLGYVPDLPQGGGLVGTNSDRVVVLWSSVGKNAPFFPYHMGRTATHEVGHYLGLFHTFDFGCGTSSSPGCYSSGDLICDTNAEANPNFGCNLSSQSCGSADPVRNYMDYSDDLCMIKFTEEQSNRMRCTLENWRPDLAESTSACTVPPGQVFRNAGTNPASYVANAPVNGGILTLSVDLTTTGHTSALVVGYNSPLTLTLGGGQTLLVNIGDPTGDLLALSTMSGPIAAWVLPVITTPGTCGLEIYSQAVHFGGVVPFVLSNAQDLTVGF